MEIINKKLSELIPYVNNPRKNDQAVNAVANSIKEFGFKVPIVLDKNNEIVTGHTRLKAAIKLKLKEVPCIVADDLSDAQIKAFRLADNKVSEFAEWDFEALNIELEGLSELDFDMGEFGFDDLLSDEVEPSEQKDLSDTVGETFEIIIELENESEQSLLYKRLQGEGFSCRVLTL